MLKSRRNLRYFLLGFTLTMILQAILFGFVYVSVSRADELPLDTVSHLAYEAEIKYHLPANAADRLVCIAMHESTFKPEARNGRYIGLMQFGPALWADFAPSQGYSVSVEDALDPLAAMDVAGAVVSQGGWQHWAPVNGGLC